MNDDFEESKAYKALLEWEAAAYREIAQCEIEMKAKHEYETESLRRGELSIAANVAKARYMLAGGKTI